MAVSVFALVALLLLICCLLYCCCYKRHQKSTWVHNEKCCEAEDKYFCSDFAADDGFVDPETCSETTTIASNYNEDKPSIELNEAYYGKYGKR